MRYYSMSIFYIFHFSHSQSKSLTLYDCYMCGRSLLLKKTSKFQYWITANVMPLFSLSLTHSPNRIQSNLIFWIKIGFIVQKASETDTFHIAQWTFVCERFDSNHTQSTSTCVRADINADSSCASNHSFFFFFF